MDYNYKVSIEVYNHYLELLDNLDYKEEALLSILDDKPWLLTNISQPQLN